MKIYTKTGDQGYTTLIGGTRVPKHHLRIEAYGTVDELNSWIGLLADGAGHVDLVADLREIQDRLFTLGSLLAADPEKNKMKLPEMTEEDVQWLEHRIDAMQQVLPEMRSFVLPGGLPQASYAHLARCVCRRAERHVTHLSELAPVEALWLKYLNRLSDYLFVVSRWLLLKANAPEIPWKPRM